MMYPTPIPSGVRSGVDAAPARPAIRRRGAAAVEFAFVAGIFFFMVLGIFEFGRAFMVMEMLTEAAREGARTAVIEGATGSQVQNAVANFLNGCMISGDTAQILVNDAPV